MQNEITAPSDLLNKNGELTQKGWAKRLLLNYNRENIKAGWAKIKEWDYYAVLCPDYGITFTFTDLGYLGLINVVWLDFKDRRFVPQDVIKLFPKGRLNLPRSSDAGDVKYDQKGVTVSFEKRDEFRGIYFKNPNFDKGKGIEAKLTLKQDPKMDTMVIATPWKEDPTRFYYNQKVNCMPATGTIQYGNKTYAFNEDAYAVLDWGRGVWTRKNRWYWGSLSGKLKDGSLLGWNIGYGFSDRSYASENMIFYNGKCHKLDEITFHPDTSNYLKPWKFTSNDGRFEMVMEPLIDRNSKTNILVLKSIQHQVFGLFTGDLVLDDGKKIHVDKMLGFAEDVFNKW